MTDEHLLDTTSLTVSKPVREMGEAYRKLARRPLFENKDDKRNRASRRMHLGLSIRNRIEDENALALAPAEPPIKWRQHVINSESMAATYDQFRA